MPTDRGGVGAGSVAAGLEPPTLPIPARCARHTPRPDPARYGRSGVIPCAPAASPGPYASAALRDGCPVPAALEIPHNGRRERSVHHDRQQDGEGDRGPEPALVGERVLPGREGEVVERADAAHAEERGRERLLATETPGQLCRAGPQAQADPAG